MMNENELVEKLRCLKKGSCSNCPMWFSEEVEPNLWRERCAAIDAADTIEALSAICEEQKAQIILMEAEIGELKGCWVPVSRRLPPDFVSVQAHIIGAEPFPSVREAYVIGDKWFFPALKEFLPVDKWKEFEEPPKEET